MSDIQRVLIAAMPRCKAPAEWAQAFAEAFGDQPPVDLAMFFAQVGHESADLNTLEEGLSYSSVDRILKIFPVAVRGLGPAELQKLVRNPERLANVAYAGKGGNGNSLTGDGWRYRGRGPIQISLKDNYAGMEADTGLPVLAYPDLLTQDKHVAARSAVWYWRKHVDDGASIQRVTRQINGPLMAGLDDRTARYQAAQRA